jgi:hypothetical protein
VEAYEVNYVHLRNCYLVPASGVDVLKLTNVVSAFIEECEYTTLTTTGSPVVTIRKNNAFSNAYGPVLTSPDGTRYRLVVANGGGLSTTAV